jgi:hypothetical protein
MINLGLPIAVVLLDQFVRPVFKTEDFDVVGKKSKRWEQKLLPESNSGG